MGIVKAHKQFMKMEISEITAAILAGGENKRFGSNKALALVNGIPIIQHIRNQLRLSVRRISVITNTPDAFVFLDLPVYRDIFPGRGPIGGLYTALVRQRRIFQKTSCSAWTFVAPCDLPFFSCNILHVLTRYIRNVDAVCFTKDGKTEPVPALFNMKILPKLKMYLKTGDYTFQTFLNKCDVFHVPLENVTDEIDPQMLLNCNTPDDYRNTVVNILPE
ncbi:hypothetical protein AMJ80_09650 [bacterium SM23_31]|nr:MAG: hypothetical protein AMJ80_09650 [bacterium SM23_31]